MGSNQLRIDLAGKLAAEGLTVALDPRNVNPPCVVIGLPAGGEMLTPCVSPVELDVTVVAPAPGNLDAIEWLLDAADIVRATLPVVRWEPSSFDPAPGTGAAPLPAYVCTVSTEVTD